MNEHESDDGRLHCPHCGWSTQLANKYERHMRKKHADVNSNAVNEALLVVGRTDEPDTEEE